LGYRQITKEEDMKFFPSPHRFATGDVLQADDLNRCFDHCRELVDETIDNAITRTTVSLAIANTAFDDSREHRTLRWVAPMPCVVEQFRITIYFNSSSATYSPESSLVVDGYVNGAPIPGLNTTIREFIYPDGASVNQYQELSRFSLNKNDVLEFVLGVGSAGEPYISQAFVDLNLSTNRWHPNSTDTSVAFHPLPINGGDPRDASQIGNRMNALGASANVITKWKSFEYVQNLGPGSTNNLRIPASSGNRKLAEVYAWVQNVSGSGGTVNAQLLDPSLNVLKTVALNVPSGYTFTWASSAVDPVLNLNGNFANTSEDVIFALPTTTVGGGAVIRGGLILVFEI
jgi:hypothetical protein